MKKIVYLLLIVSMQLFGVNDPLYRMPQPLYGKYNPLAKLFVTSYNDKTFDTPLTVRGVFKGTKLKTKDIASCGPMEIKDSIIDGSIETFGSLIIENSTVAGKVKAKGGISAKDVTFQDSIEGNTVLLKNSVAKKDIETIGTEKALVKEEIETTFWYKPTVTETDITGSLRAENSTIQGKVKAKGRIWAERSKFEDAIEGYDTIFFTDKVIAKDIHVKGQKEYVGLLGLNVTVDGTIYFDSESRGIAISEDTTITGGIKVGTRQEWGPFIKGKEVEPQEEE